MQWPNGVGRPAANTAGAASGGGEHESSRRLAGQADQPCGCTIRLPCVRWSAPGLSWCQQWQGASECTCGWELRGCSRSLGSLEVLMALSVQWQKHGAAPPGRLPSPLPPMLHGKRTSRHGMGTHGHYSLSIPNG